MRRRFEPRVLTLKFAGKCAKCAKTLPVGTEATWAGRGMVYCLGECTGDDTRSHREKYGQCEDAPCCGCCGSNVYGGY